MIRLSLRNSSSSALVICFLPFTTGKKSSGECPILNIPGLLSEISQGFVQPDVLFHYRDRRARFQAFRGRVVEGPERAGLEFLVRGFNPFIFQDRQLAGTDDVFAEKQSHGPERVIVAHVQGFEGVGVVDDLFVIVLAFVDYGDSLLFQLGPKHFSCASA